MKCTHVIGYRGEGFMREPIPCGEPVRYEGSFVCEKHIWDTSKKKKTIKQMQEEIKKWKPI